MNTKGSAGAGQMAYWLGWQGWLPTTGDVVLYPIPPMGELWRDCDKKDELKK